MIIKDADGRADDLRALKALRTECAPEDRRRIDDEIRNIDAGLKGERSTAHFMGREFSHDDDVIVVHDLRIAHGADHAQIDHLVLDRTTGIAWVAETKNYAATLAFDGHGGWIVEYPGRTHQIESPIAQARRHCTTLTLWLADHGVPARDVRAVVLLGTKTGIDRDAVTDPTPIMKSDVFPQWLADRRSTDAAATTVAPMTEEDFARLGAMLVEAHRPAQPANWARRLGVRRTNTMTGRGPQRAATTTPSPSMSLSNHAGTRAELIIIAMLIAAGAYGVVSSLGHSETPTSTSMQGVRDNAGRTTATDAGDETDASTPFPASGTVVWGPRGQPISGELARLDVWDVTQSHQRKVIRIRDARAPDAPPVATAHLEPGDRVTLTLRPGVYAVTAASGDGWNAVSGRFASRTTTVSFGTVEIRAGTPGVVAMGAPDQTADVVDGTEF